MVERRQKMGPFRRSVRPVGRPIGAFGKVRRKSSRRIIYGQCRTMRKRSHCLLFRTLGGGTPACTNNCLSLIIVVEAFSVRFVSRCYHPSNADSRTDGKCRITYLMKSSFITFFLPLLCRLPFRNLTGKRCATSKTRTLFPVLSMSPVSVPKTSTGRRRSPSIAVVTGQLKSFVSFLGNRTRDPLPVA